jgi:hypothetical protein
MVLFGTLAPALLYASLRRDGCFKTAIACFIRTVGRKIGTDLGLKNSNWFQNAILWSAHVFVCVGPVREVAVEEGTFCPLLGFFVLQFL